MQHITIEARCSAWVVTTGDGAAATWPHLDFARHLGALEPVLGAGVPVDALERGRLLGEALRLL